VSWFLANTVTVIVVSATTKNDGAISRLANDVGVSAHFGPVSKVAPTGAHSMSKVKNTLCSIAAAKNCCSGPNTGIFPCWRSSLEIKNIAI
jgi:hypothetical protein